MNTTAIDIGTKMGGGYFTGIVLMDGIRFAVITAGKSCEISGEYGMYGEKIAGTGSFVDSLANTNAMAAAGSELAQKARALREGDYDDWAIPARDVQELQYRNLKPTTTTNYCSYLDGYNAHSVPQGALYTEQNPLQTTVEEFKAGGSEAFEPAWYWSSTQSSADIAFVQDFTDGYQSTLLKDTSSLVRPVRMIPIQ